MPFVVYLKSEDKKEGESRKKAKKKKHQTRVAIAWNDDRFAINVVDMCVSYRILPVRGQYV